MPVCLGARVRYRLSQTNHEPIFVGEEGWVVNMVARPVNKSVNAAEWVTVKWDHNGYWCALRGALELVSDSNTPIHWDDMMNLWLPRDYRRNEADKT